MPRLYIISGCNGSGKTTASYTLLPELLDCSEFVNSDEFAKSLSPFAPESAYILASRFMLKKVQYLFQRREDFCIETTLATRSLLKMVRSAQEQGYFVTIIYFCLNSPDMAVERVAARVAAGGHHIPEDTIRRRYHSGLDYFFRYYMPECDKWILADNSCPPFHVVAEGTRKGMQVRDPKLYSQIQESLTETPEAPARVQDVAQEVAQAIAHAPIAQDGIPAFVKSDNDPS